MNETPDPINKRSLTRASVAGAIIGASAVITFIVLWIILGNWGMDQFARLVISVCIPPALIALIMGAYFLLIRSNHDN